MSPSEWEWASESASALPGSWPDRQGASPRVELVAIAEPVEVAIDAHARAGAGRHGGVGQLLADGRRLGAQCRVADRALGRAVAREGSVRVAHPAARDPAEVALHDHVALGHRAAEHLRGERRGGARQEEIDARPGDGRVRRGAAAGAAAEAGGDEDHVRTFEDFDDLVGIFQGSLAADVGIGAGAQALGELGAELQLDGGLRKLQRLQIGIGGDEFDALELGADHAVDGVGAAAAHADYFYLGAFLAAVTETHSDPRFFARHTIPPKVSCSPGLALTRRRTCS